MERSINFLRSNNWYQLDLQLTKNEVHSPSNADDLKKCKLFPFSSNNL